MSELKIYNPTPRSRLFPNIEREPIVRCTAEWKTIISEAQRKGRENRTAKLSEPRLSVEGDGFILDDDSYATLSQAFIDSSGKFTGFPYKFPLDYYCTATPEYYDTGVYQQGILHPLTTTTFQICKRYSVVGICSYKTLTNIVNGTISIYKDGVLVTSGATVNLTTGVVTFAVAPTGSLTISCEYRFKFRFDVDDLQLTLIRKVVEGYDGGYSAYKAINFKLVEDDYDKVSPLTVTDWTSDIAYDFSLKGSPDLTYSERVLSFIEKGDNNKEAREAFTATRRQFKQESSNRKWKDIQRKYTLFNVAKGRLLTFDFEGVNVRFDQDEFSSEVIGNNAWTFEGLSMIETLYSVGDEVKNFAHCIKIELPPPPPIIHYVYVASYQQGGISDPSNWRANLCNAGVRVRTIEPFSITGYEGELTDPQKTSIRNDILTNARYKADGIFYVLEWNGQKKRLVPTGDTGSGIAKIQQPVIDHVLSLGGVYHTPTCVTGSWLSANTPIYMMVDEGENIIININNPVETTFI